MIVRKPPHWAHMIFVWHGSVLREILPQLALMLVVALMASHVETHVLGERATSSFTLVGVTLALFLAFRNNVSYARYWEARQLWGEMVISSRTLLSRTLCYFPSSEDEATRDCVLRHLVALAYALKRQLRGEDETAALPMLTAAENAALAPRGFKPVAILHMLRRLAAPVTEPGMRGLGLSWVLDEVIVRLESVIGGCERIAATPIPFPYAVLMRRTVFIYCILLPFGLAEVMGAFTPVVSVFVAYTLLALEQISNEIADPFGTSENDLPLESFCRNIERNLLDLMGRPIPPPPAAEPGHVLR